MQLQGHLVGPMCEDVGIVKMGFFAFVGFGMPVM